MSAAHRSALESAVGDARLGDAVTISGRLDDEALADTLRTADVFVNLRHPSSEVASGALVEQLRTGRPVVVSDIGCFSELPDDVVRKVPVSGEVPALRSTLEGLLADPASREAIGAAGAAYAEATHAAERYAAAFDDIARRTMEALPRVRKLRTQAKGISAEPHSLWDGLIAAAIAEVTP